METTNPLSIQGSPLVPGVCFRKLRDNHDYIAMAQVHRDSQEWDQVDPRSAREHVPSAEQLEQMFTEVLTQHPDDLLIVEHNTRVIGYSQVFWNWTEVTGVPVYLHLGYLLPEWRDKGIGSAMLHWAQARIRANAHQEPHRDQAMFATNVSSTEREADLLMRNNGYQVVRRLSDMILDRIVLLPPWALPSGVVLRLIEPQQYRAVYQAWKDAFSTIWTSTPESEEGFQAFLAYKINNVHFDQRLSHVAWAGNEVVGLALCEVNQGIAYFPEIAVRQTWQRKGIARTLMTYAINAMYERGIPQVRLYTDADDGQGARSLYETLGFREIKQHMFYRKPIQS
jgi:ribosomal protein S18 acetylase RimI-like enzyme